MDSPNQPPEVVRLRQLSLDTTNDQYGYRPWNRTPQQLGLGPVVNSQTIPARGVSPEGIGAHMLHISVRRHYKEKVKSKSMEHCVVTFSPGKSSAGHGAHMLHVSLRRHYKDDNVSRSVLYDLASNF